MPTNRGRGGRWQSHRRVINGIPFRQRTGIPWRDLPPCFGSWKTVHDSHRRWSADGTWERILRAVQAGRRRCRGPDRLEHGQRRFHDLPRTRPDHIGEDTAYSSRRNRRHLRRRQIRHTIPEPRDQRANRRRRGSPGGRGRPQASTRRSTAAATRSSGPSTGSRTSEPSPRASTSGRTSSTGRSPWLLSGYGSVRNETPRSELVGTWVVVAQFAEYARVDSPDVPR